ncbi:MAG TPA: hypothetical protein VGM26_17260 [Rhizomicrobium sp.]|jgi:hypothetical protein
MGKNQHSDEQIHDHRRPYEFLIWQARRSYSHRHAGMPRGSCDPDRSWQAGQRQYKQYEQRHDDIDSEEGFCKPSGMAKQVRDFTQRCLKAEGHTVSAILSLMPSMNAA